MILEINFKPIIRDILRILRTEILRKSFNPHTPSQKKPIQNDHARIRQMSSKQKCHTVSRTRVHPGPHRRADGAVGAPAAA